MKFKSTIAIILAGLSLSLGTISGIKHFSNTKREAPAEAAAVNGVTLYTANDATCSDTKYYSQSGGDKTSLSYTSDLRSTNAALYSFSQGEAAYSATENSSDKKLYNYVYRPFFVYPQETGYTGIPKASRYTVNITFKLTLNKAASGGTARAFAELFFLGNGNGKPEPTLANGTFNTNDSQTSDTSTSYNNAATSSDSIGVFTNKASTPIYTTKSLSITFDNDSATSNNVVRYQLGLFVGCNYASGKDHTTSATVEMTINSVAKSDLIAQVGSNCYTDFSYALSAYNNAANQTLKLLQNVSVNAATEAYRNVNVSGTINLGGFTLSSNNMFALSIRNNSTVTIQNGTIAHTGAQYAITVLAGSTLTVSSNVTITSSTSGCILSSGTVTVNGTLNATSSGYALNNDGVATLSGATLSTNSESSSCVYNEGTLNIYNSTLNANSGGKSLFIASASAITRIYGNSSLPRSIEVKTGCNNQQLYLYNGTTRYTGSTMNLKFNDALVNGDKVFYAYNSSDTSKISVTNSLDSYLHYEYNTTSKAYTVTYTLYSITVNISNATYTISKSSNVTYADTVTINVTLNTGYQLLNSGVTSSGCYRSMASVSDTQKTITITKTTANATVTITPTLKTYSLVYDGNGTSSYTTNVNKEGYIKTNPTYTVTHFDEVTILDNAFRRDGYYFTGWNTEPDGSGQDYVAGDVITISSGLTLYAQWIDVSYADLDQFVTDYMHMNNYNQNLGYCISYNGGDGYYVIAKRVLVTFDSTTINVFRTDTRYSSAKNRYEQWAYFNNDLEYAYVDDFTHISSSNETLLNIKNDSVAITVVCSIIVTTSIIGFVFLTIKKRKEQ